jgi:prophage regulatory protein
MKTQAASAPIKDGERIIRYVTFKELCAYVTYSRPHIARLVRAGKFPAPVRLSPNRIAWLEHELLDWGASLPRVVYQPPLADGAPRRRGRPAMTGVTD